MKDLLYIGGVLLLLFLSGERETDLRRRLNDEVTTASRPSTSSNCKSSSPSSATNSHSKPLADVSTTETPAHPF